MFKWLKTNKAVARSMAGLEEKQKVTDSKNQLAEKLTKMFDRREHPTQVDTILERRHPIGAQNV